MAWGDEGGWNHAAAYAAATGDWPPTPDAPQRRAPLYVWLQRGAFALWGPGLAQARVLSVVSGVLTTGCIGLMLWPLGRRWSFFGAGLYASNFWAIAVDRTAQPEALCVCLLSLAMLACCMPGRSAAAQVALGTTLAVLAATAKPPAAFGFVAVAAFALRRRRSWPGAVAGLSIVVAVLVASLGLAWLTDPGRRLIESFAAQAQADLAVYGVAGSARPTALARTWAIAWIQAPLFYPFAVHLAAPIAGALLLLGRPADGEALESRHEHGLIAFAACWLLAWWMLVPLTSFRGGRVAFVSVPLVVLGTLGFRRLFRPTPGARAWRGVALAFALLWLAAMCSAWLADHGRFRARVWLALLVATSACALVLVRRAGARMPLPLRDSPPVVAALALTLCTGQALVFAAWLPERTHMIAEAQQHLAGLDLGSAVVCGSHAPALLLASPHDRVPLPTAYAPDCRLAGRLADFVLLPRGEWCLGAYPQEFLVTNAAFLETLPEQARVLVDQWRGNVRRTCALSLIRLPRAWSPPTPGTGS
jgi:4-amino-4-deoxy-L-arabinose transferase-like glycosyltransferase